MKQKLVEIWEVDKSTVTVSNLASSTKDVKDPPIDNYKLKLRRKNLKDINKMRDTPCSLIGRLKILDVILPKLIYKFNTISIKIPAGFFLGPDKLILKFIWKCKWLRINKTTLKKNNVGEQMLLNFKTYIKTIVIKSVILFPNLGKLNIYLLYDPAISPENIYPRDSCRHMCRVNSELGLSSLNRHHVWPCRLP